MLGLRKLVRSLKQSRPQILQTFLYHANIAGRVAGWLAGVPHVVSGIRVAENRSRFRLALDRWTERFVDRHVCVGQAVAEFSAATGGLSRDKLVVVRNGVDHQAITQARPVNLHEEFQIPADRKVVLFVGRLDPQKDPILLLHAIEDVGSPCPTHAVFVGDGPERETLELAAVTLGVDDRVTFAGRRDDVFGLMKGADCLVLPSRWEGLPNVILEAMSVGLPVIATRAHGSAELLERRQLGALVEIGDAVGLNRAICECFELPDVTVVRAKEAQLMVQKELTWDSCSEEFAAVYRDLLR